ncbi:hypothetical protein NQ317_003183 [Molorchus minor]|uniref:CCHC-type domain-containing protein n=1 Tax=Molorchus minor TaxID=1323400 RepID=A0ABQ9JI89_9CUCU|nr:hypothetical protein NQ317_003183 [Molorchus minor]
MEQNKKRRKVLRSAFTKHANDIEAILASSDRTADVLRSIQVSWELLAQKHDAMKAADSDIYEEFLAADASEEDLLTEMEQCDNYEKRFADLKIRYNNVFSNGQTGKEVDSESVVSEASGVTRRHKFKLPTIEFKKIYGNIRDWLSFWSQFKKIHKDHDIALEDKIEYLIQATVPGSRARQLVESFSALGENYEKIVQGLEVRFGREDLQIEVYVRELLKLILHNAMSKNKMDLFTLYDRIETQLRALETLGVTSEKCSAMLFPLIESCLPEDLLRVWQRVGRRASRSTELGGQSGSSESIDTKGSLESHLKDLMDGISLAAEGFGLYSDNPSAFKEVKRRSKANDAIVPTASALISCDVVKKSQTFTLEHKKEVLSGKKACFRCLKIGHQAKRCRVRLKCIICGKSHVSLICPDLPAHKRDIVKQNNNQTNANDVCEQTLANNTGGYVFLETLRVRINGPCSSRDIRALIDTGSQRSDILKSTAQQLGYRSNRQITIVHCLFGGIEQSQTHDCFDVRLSNGDISPVFEGPWMEEVKGLNVHLSDVRGTGPIELLIGADFAGRLYTGITDTLEKRSRDEMAAAAKEYFLETVPVDESGRYEVRLPWLDGHPSLPNNYHLAKKRLETIVKRLNKDGLFDSYDQVFQEWLQDDVIEEVSVEEGKLIPSILLRFREHKIGVISDIRKAFLQIGVHKSDRDFLRFLWLDSEGNEKLYRHRRVVFGVTSSPFLLGATIQHHLSEKLKLCTPYSQETILRLSKSFYVDNCVTSVSTEDILEQFILESSMLMAEAKFDLRGWESTQPTGHTNVPVLGLTWTAKKDVLTITQRVFDPIGFTSPATLIPKVLLQRTWEKRQGWDTPVDSKIEFKNLDRGSPVFHEGPLTGDEFDAAEVFVFKVIQQETFPDTRDKTLCSLHPVRDELGLLRLKSRVSNRQDIDTFRFPVILSAKHPVVRRLIFDLHEKSYHVGTQGLLSLLREKFWIVGGRRAVRSVISKCVVCKRHFGTSSPWWGGFWKRLIGVMKRLIRKVLGGACLNFEELLTLICDCESIINSRPLIDGELATSGVPSGGPSHATLLPICLMSQKDLISLTPAMFLQDLVENGIPDCDAVDRASLCRRIRYKQKTREHLRNRFRSEYLGQLKLIGGKRPLGQVSLGDVVLIGNDNKKRLTWPLDRIVELIPGKDGTVRLVRVDTAKGQLLRPLQRIYPLECTDVKEIGKEIRNAETSASDIDDRSRHLRQLEVDDQVCDNASAGVYKSRVPDANVYVTRSGRLVKQPSRFKE